MSDFDVDVGELKLSKFLIFFNVYTNVVLSTFVVVYVFLKKLLC